MSQNVSAVSDGLGNTLPSRNRSRSYQITINNYDKEKCLKCLKTLGMEYLIGFEEAPTTGTKHCHIYLESKVQVEFNKIKKTFPEGHIEKCKGNRQQNIDYIIKDGNYEGTIKIEVPYTWKDVIPGELFDWQKELEEIIKGPADSRKIYWYWEEIGNKGKSTFAKYLYMKYDFVQFTTCTKSADILLSASKEKSVYILDIPRSNAHFEPWNAIEQLKNGFICDAKLKKDCKVTCIRPPHVIIFSNYSPDESKLSDDRWIIKYLV